MLRRVVVLSGFNLAYVRSLSISGDVRENLSKHLTALKEECKGQGLDLEDMRETARAASQTLQDAVKRSNVEDAKFKGKMTTLNASMKAYNTRLSNLQNESRSIQNELDAVLKLLWGTEKPQGDSFATPPPRTAAESSAPKKEDDFGVEPPPISKILEGEGKPVEQVVAERVVEGEKAAPKSSSTTVSSEEIEVETIEIEMEPEAEAKKDDPVDTMKITDITQDLYEKGVNFSDCLDAQSLRQRYRDVLSGKIPYRGAQKAQKPYTEPLTDTNTSQPRMPARQSSYSAQQPPPPPPNSSETGIASDPYPNAQRKMVDPMRYVHEIKAELAMEKGIDANSVDLWSGKTKLEDHNRLYDYPSIQSYPIEVRQKGDIPR